MTDYGWAAKAMADFGGLGLIAIGLVMLYRLADKWGGKFLEAQMAQAQAMAAQAAAMTGLAQVVRDGHGDQREVLIAVRLHSAQLEEVKGYMREISGKLTEGKA